MFLPMAFVLAGTAVGAMGAPGPAGSAGNAAGRPLPTGATPPCIRGSSASGIARLPPFTLTIPPARTVPDEGADAASQKIGAAMTIAIAAILPAGRGRTFDMCDF